MTHGEPEDVPCKCNAHCYIGDNFGDNHATMRCEREAGHSGEHREVFSNRVVRVFWDVDERRYHKDCGKGTSDAGPEHPDCACRATEKQSECAAAGCGFCGAAEHEEDPVENANDQ